MKIRFLGKIIRVDFVKSQINMFGGGGDKPVKNPGIKGGKYWINDKGRVVYGQRPGPKQIEKEKKLLVEISKKDTNKNKVIFGANKNHQVELRNRDDLPLQKQKQIERMVSMALNYYASALKNTKFKKFLKDIKEDEGLVISDGSEPVSGMVIMVNDKKDIGMGTSSKGSFKIFVSGDKTDFLGTDADYVLLHELHHTFGSNSEFDVGSDVATIEFRYKNRDMFSPEQMKDVNELVYKYSRVKSKKLNKIKLITGENKELKAFDYLVSNYRNDVVRSLREIGYKEDQINNLVF